MHRVHRQQAQGKTPSMTHSRKNWTSWQSETNLLIMGDINARIGNDVIKGIKQRFNKPTKWEQWSVNNILYIKRTPYKQHIFLSQKQHKIIWFDTRGRTSTIDLIDCIISNRAIHLLYITNIRSFTLANIGSDYNFVICNFRQVMQRKRIPPFRRKSKRKTEYRIPKRWHKEILIRNQTKIQIYRKTKSNKMIQSKQNGLK